MTSGVTLARAYGKINLELRVLGRRSDGYHDLRTVFQTIALHDTLAFVTRDGPFRIHCAASGVPLDERNLIWRAADALWRALARSGRPRDAVVHLKKRVPSQAGLGGGSSNAAAALVALAHLWGARLATEDLVPIAASLGADVPFFLCGGTASGAGRGDEIRPLPDVPHRWVVLLVPSFGISTGDAFAWWDGDRRASLESAPAESPVARVPVWSDVATVNDLQAPIARRHADIDRMTGALLGAGATGAAMTGSGSTVFGLFEAGDAARRAVASLRPFGWRVVLTQSVDRATYGRRSRPVTRRAYDRHLP